MKQSDIFLKGEGDAWHKRNKKTARLPDMVLEAIKETKLQPRSVLELGCGDGWRLAEIKKLWNCHCIGYDPSMQAVCEGKALGLNLEVGTAKEGLYFTKEKYHEMIIFGFCLYLVDREDLQMIVGLADRALKDGGHIVIHDFLVENSYTNKYKHKEGVLSYKMDYALLWMANPAYTRIFVNCNDVKDEDKRIGVTILRKNLGGWNRP